MKNSHHVAVTDNIDNRMELSNHKVAIPRSKLLSGSLEHKYPIILDDGKTVIFISDKSKEAEARKKYEQRMDYMTLSHFKKPRV